MTISEQLKLLPKRPGIYIFKDVHGSVLYIGKAKALHKRVSSYFRPHAPLDPAKQAMVKQVAHIDTIICDTENEALVLEANHIRLHKPPYNVVLTDDKYYLFIKITAEDVPRVFPVRRVRGKGRYFGPYSSASSVRQTLKLLRRLFPHKTEKESPREIVFPHPLFKTPSDSPLSRGEGSRPDKGGKGWVSRDEYHQNIQNIIRFLKGDRDHIIKTLRAGMQTAAKKHEFERAAIFRNQLQALERLEGHQKVHLARRESFDVVSIASRETHSAANVFAIRGGKLVHKDTFLLKHRGSTSAADVVRQFFLQYYAAAQDIPPRLYVPVALSDSAALARWINSERAPLIAVPQRGVKRQLLRLGVANAEQLLAYEASHSVSAEQARVTLHELATALGLGDRRLHRIETYDISNIQGQLATGSLVVFTDGVPTRNQYRTFRIKQVSGPNDFAMMAEVLHRRLKHTAWPKPDLILIDGGKGQLSAALRALQEEGADIPVAAVAKREELLFVPGQSDPIRLPFDSAALYLVQRMRDEAHRVTLGYHRHLRSKRSVASVLDEVPGIGPKTKKKLLRHFGSVAGIRQASDEELTKLIGAKASVVRDYL
jgi:excinuclease ABC subunit C